MKTLMHFKNFYEEIRTSNSRKFKQDILQKYKDDEQIRFYLHFAFNPYITTGISFKKLGKIVGGSNIKHLNSIPEFLTYLSQHNTGTDQVVSLCQELISNAAVQVDRDAANLLELLICKDLSIGCDVKTINSVMSGLIPTFEVQLAQKYFEKPEKVVGKEFAVTTKIDGGRIIAIKENGQVSFFTRAGQKYEGLVDLEEEMKSRIPDNFVLDGEITLLDYQNYDSKIAYKQAMKITRADGPKSGVKMLVFDGMPVENWKAQYCPYSWHARRSTLDAIFSNSNFTHFELLPVLYQGTDASKILEFLDSEIARGQEGIMINICDAPYEFKRTWNLMKVKKMNTVDLEIVGFEEGSGRLAGTLGAIHVRYKDGNIVKVGSGFSDELRDLIWKKAFLEQPDLCKIVEIQYFEETTNADGGISLRFPVFKDFRPDKTEADF
jgi:DNA ligase-1